MLNHARSRCTRLHPTYDYGGYYVNRKFLTSYSWYLCHLLTIKKNKHNVLKLYYLFVRQMYPISPVAPPMSSFIL